MFMVVYCSSDFGFDYEKGFETHKQAYEYIAHSVKEFYGFDLMPLYPLSDKDDCLRHDDRCAGTKVFAGYNWCNCCDYDCEDKYLIIEV